MNGSPEDFKRQGLNKWLSSFTAVLEFMPFLFVLFQGQHGQYEDVRCKCVCPAVAPQNGTASRNVFIGQFTEPSSW